MQTTIDHIEEELRRYTAAGCAKPDCVYLGRREHGIVAKAAAQFGIGTGGSPVDDEANRLELRGLKVYRVDASTYLGFGTSQPSPCG